MSVLQGQNTKEGRWEEGVEGSGFTPFGSVGSVGSVGGKPRDSEDETKAAMPGSERQILENENPGGWIGFVVHMSLHAGMCGINTQSFRRVTGETEKEDKGIKGNPNRSIQDARGGGLKKLGGPTRCDTAGRCNNQCWDDGVM